MIKRALLLGSLLHFRSGDSGGGSGGAPALDPIRLGEGATAPEVTGATHEEKISAAQGLVGRLFTQAQGLFNQVAKLTGDLATANTEKDRVQGLYDTLVTEANNLRTETTRLTGELNTANTNLATEKTHVTNLSSYCGVLGIDPAKAMKAPKEGGDGPGTVSAVKEEFGRIKAQEDKGDVPKGTASKFYRKHKKDLAAE